MNMTKIYVPIFESYSLMKLFLIPLLLLLASAVVSSTAQCEFPAIVNFGDSNSDTGGLSASFGPVVAPHGITFFKRPAGRFCDGRLILDFIAESFGLPYLSAYLDSVGANFSRGISFTVSVSTIVDQNVTLSQGGYSPFYLGVQLNQFLQFKPRSQSVYERGGVFMDLMPREEYFSRALYTIDIGQNDLTADIDAARRGNKSAEEFFPDALSEFSRVIKSVYESGGRYFWIHNTGPLGCLPYVLLARKLTPSQLDPVGCGIMYNELARRFNVLLNETVVQLRIDLPRAKFTYVDVYSAKYMLISQAEKFGFDHPLEVCCGYGGGPYNFDFDVRCGDTSEVNGTKVLLGKSCKDPSRRIMWDGVHYTEAANKWVFDRISTGEFSDPPNSLSMACQG